MSNAAPRLLILETSGRPGQVALAEGGVLCARQALDQARHHARDLTPTVARLLEQAGWQPRSLAGVLVSCGPGSYTGLRVGIMSAKALAYATGCALIGIETFASLAVQAPLHAAHLAVLADAQQGKVYVQEYRRSLADTAPIASTALAIHDLAKWLEQHHEGIWLTGPGLGPNTGRIPVGWQRVPEELWDPQPESLLQLGWARFQAGKRDDPYTLEPLYLRPSAAEEKWTAKQ